jgi:hypothetical protein
MRGGITEKNSEMDLNLGLPPDCTFEKNPIIVLFRCSYLGKETVHNCNWARRQTEKKNQLPPDLASARRWEAFLLLRETSDLQEAKIITVISRISCVGPKAPLRLASDIFKWFQHLPT